MRRLHYHRLNVFTDRRFGGNPLAVFTNARGVTSETMQAIAKEFNISETTFVLPANDPRNDWCVRIFTPTKELPMAGHPTIGTAFVLASEHLVQFDKDQTTIALEEIVGTIPVRIEFKEGRPVFAEMVQPRPIFGPRLDESRAAVAETLSLTLDDLDPDLPIEAVSCGVPILIVPLRNLDAARRASPRADAIAHVLKGNAPREIFVFTKEVENESSSVHCRFFGPFFGIPEDPATGGASGPLGSYLVHHGAQPGGSGSKIIIEQGIEMGRPSVIEVTIESSGKEIATVKVGGQCYFAGEGFIEF